MLTRCLAILALSTATLPAVAAADDADLIGGFRTNDFNRFWPEGEDAPQGYRQTARHSNPAQHLAVADYEAEDGQSLANIRIIAWPPDAPVAIEDGDPDIIQRSVAGIRAMMADEGFPEPTDSEITTPEGITLSCLTVQPTQTAEQVCCVTPIKGRVMEIQHFASVTANDEEARRELATGFVTSLTDHVAAAQ